MKPYYEDDYVTLYHGDCREFHPQADCVVTDPPYGVGMNAFVDDFDVGCRGVDLPLSPSLAAVFTSPRRVPALVSSLKSWKFERLLWMHKTADIAAPWRGWCMNSEAIGIFSRVDAKWPKPRNFRSDTYSVGPWERAGHPNGKPIDVVTDLVVRLCNETVYDPFSGSGTTLMAAKNLGLRAIGVEIEERFCEIAARRLSQEVLNLGGAA